MLLGYDASHQPGQIIADRIVVKAEKEKP